MPESANPLGLDLLGWKPFVPVSSEIFEREKKFMLAFPHSSLADAVVACFYLTLDPYISKHSSRFKTLINKNQLDRFYGPMLKSKLGAIPVDSTCKGNLKNIKEELKKCDEYILLVSPKGSTSNKPWRTGWYHMAKELDLPILVAGPDYRDHEVKCAEDFIRLGDKSPDEVILEMMEEMKKISNKHLTTESYETFAVERGTFVKPANENCFLCLTLVLLAAIFINYSVEN